MRDKYRPSDLAAKPGFREQWNGYGKLAYQGLWKVFDLGLQPSLATCTTAAWFQVGPAHCLSGRISPRGL